VQNLNSAALGFLNSWRPCWASSRIHCLHPSRLRCHLNPWSVHSSQADSGGPKHFQVHYLHHLRQDGGQFFSFSGHSTHEFVFQGGSLLTKLVTQVIFLTIQMQPHHHAKCWTRTLGRSFQYLKWILRRSFTCFEREIPSVYYTDSDWPATFPQSHGPLPFYSISFTLPQSEFPSNYQDLLYPMLAHCRPVTWYLPTGTEPRLLAVRSWDFHESQRFCWSWRLARLRTSRTTRVMSGWGLSECIVQYRCSTWWK
jgi:hypothetical protein